MNFRYASVANRTVRALNDRLFALFGVRLVRSSSLERMHVELRNLQKQRDASQLVSREVAGTWVLAELDDGTRLWVDLGDYGVSHACMFGTYEPVETGFVRSMLKSGQYFIDIGANIGWFTMLAARIVGPSGRVYAFEPRPNTCERLRMSISENGYSNVEVRQVALGAAPGRMTVATLMSTQNPGGTWLIATDALVGTLHDGHERFEVDVLRLDDLALDRCDLLKIDIEGAEQLAFSGAVETIQRLRPIIISEINPEVLRIVSCVSASQFVGFVERLGYRAHSVTAAGPGPALETEFASTLKSLVNVAFLPT